MTQVWEIHLELALDRYPGIESLDFDWVGVKR